MARLRKFLALPAAEQALLFRVAVSIIVVRVGLQVVRFPVLRQLLDWYAGRRPVRPEVDPAMLANLSRAFATVSRFLLGPDTCFIQALAARTVLARYGQPSRLCIGVKKDTDGKLLAHAWVESGDQVVIGGPVDHDYSAFPDF